VVGAAFYFDGAVLSWFAGHQSPRGTAFMRSVTRWGDWPSHVALGVMCAALANALQSRRWVIIFLSMIAACAVAGSVNRVIKVGAGRSRPSVEVDAGWNGPRWSSKYHAFPSGHTAASVGFFAALCFARPRIGLCLLPVPLLIAVSRLYLRAHHLSDVVFATFLGVGCAYFAWRLVSAKTERWRGRGTQAA